MKFSASRIGLWIACNRKAGWKYLCGYPEGEGDAQARGKRVHKILENLKRKGVLPDRSTEDGAIAAEALPHVEDLVYEGENGPVQLEAEYGVKGRHEWVLIRDIMGPGHVRDYKTTSDFKWAKTEAELLSDPQAILYAYEYFSVHPGEDTVTLTWIYLRSKEPYGSHIVQVVMTRRHATAGFEVLERFADRMQAASDAAPEDITERHKYVLTLAPNESRCKDYRGCPYRRHCTDLKPFKDPTDPINERNNHMSLLDELSAMLAEDGPKEVRVDNVADAATAVLGLVGHPVPANPTPGGNPMSSERADMPPATTQAVNPPKRERKPRQPKPVATDTIPAPPPTQPETPEAKEEAPAAAGDKGAELASLLAEAEAEEHIMAAADAARVARDREEGPKPAPRYQIDVLCVGCIIRGPETESAHIVDFDSLVAKARDLIGPASYFGDYGYKTNGRLLEHITRLIDDEHIESLVVVDPRTPEAILALSMLRSKAGAIVESVRQ